MFKFADDRTVVGLISCGNKSAYRNDQKSPPKTLIPPPVFGVSREGMLQFYRAAIESVLTFSISV